MGCPPLLSHVPLKSIRTRQQKRFSACDKTPVHLDLQSRTPHVSPLAVSALRQLYTRSNAEIHRGKCAHHLGRRSADALSDARQVVATMMSVPDAEEVVFSNDLYSAYTLLARAATASLHPGDEILLSGNLPDLCLHIWHAVAHSRKLLPRIVPTRLMDGHVSDVADFAHVVSSRTRVVVIPYICPLTLQIVATPMLTPFLRAVARTTVIDASVYAECLPVPKVTELDADFVLTHPGAAFIPSGAVIIGKKSSWESFPPSEGADYALSNSAFNTDDHGTPQFAHITMPLDLSASPAVWAPSPDRFEPLSTVVANAVTTAAAIDDHTNRFNDDTVEHGKILAQKLHSDLADCPYVSILSPKSEIPELPIACFTIAGAEIDRVVHKLKLQGVMVEAGDLGLSVGLRVGAGIDAAIRVTFDPLLHSESNISDFVSRLQAASAEILRTSCSAADVQ